MLYGILATLLCILGLFIILLVSVQKSHGGFWSGPANAESSVFGGSGGSDILQKITWICGFLLIISCFSLAIFRTRMATKSKYISVKPNLLVHQTPQTLAENQIDLSEAQATATEQ